jgi:hypothetical protein
VNECTLRDNVMKKSGGPVASTRVCQLALNPRSQSIVAFKVCGCYAVTSLNRPLDLIGMWFSGIKEKTS